MNALFEYEQYMPHGMCLLWEPWLVLLWSGSDLMIFAAYMAIPMAIILVLRRRPDLNHRGLVSLFAGFILLCGVTHALSIVTLWYAIYPFMGSVKLATGVISLTTAAVLFRLIPVFARIPNPERHEEVIRELETTLADLSKARDELDARVKERTDALNDANSQLSYTARDAVQRSRNLIQIVSSLTRPGVDVSAYPVTFLRDLRGRINALAIATSTVMEQRNTHRASIERVVRRQVEPLFAQPDQQLITEGPEIFVGAQGAQQISLAAWELASRLSAMPRARQESVRIDVRWTTESSEDGGEQIEFKWHEWHGGANEGSRLLVADDATGRVPDPLPEFSEDLLTRIIPHLIGGEGQVERGPETFVYTLRCSLTALDNSEDIAADEAFSIDREAARLSPA
ncbi:HWE histidine kinase domain-containing protein [Qipengyuania nanhaisediminis]|uniref:HWE histidine kinase domain-containing protein n=1 Tax=Qipengyuania nanhaisediminis TaxID=604088 RepID=UPI0038B329A7